MKKRITLPTPSLCVVTRWGSVPGMPAPGKRQALDAGRYVYDYMRPFIQGTHYERLWVIPIDLNAGAVYDEPVEVGQGSRDQVLVEEVEVFTPVLLAGVTHFILVHNHPSGYSGASPADYAVTRRLRKPSSMLGLTFRDHVVVGDGEYFSFREKTRLLRSRQAGPKGS